MTDQHSNMVAAFFLIIAAGCGTYAVILMLEMNASLRRAKKLAEYLQARRDEADE